MVSARLRAGLALALVALLAEPVLAHAGSLGNAAASGSAPAWFVFLTGGAIVGGSFLFATLLTDHEAIRTVNAYRLRVPLPAALRGRASAVLGVASVVLLVGVVVLAFAGPFRAEANAAILFVWALWWAGYAMTVYLVADTWRLLNPWRQLASALPTGDREIPDWVDDWPAVVGLLALVWLEVVSPVASNPRLLGVVVIGYTVATLAGAVTFGADAWFDRVDPVARVFRTFGQVAPLHRTDGGLALGAPGARLALPSASGRDESLFVVALLWGTTFDGFVSTPLWASLAEAAVGVGVPGLAVYLVALVVGYALFLAAYRVAARRSRASAETLVTAEYIGRWFAYSLIPIAAGYHLAHFLGYFLRLSPQVLAVLSDPLGTTGIVGLVAIPAWFSLLELTFVLAGHMFAIWVAHGRSFELFPGTLQPIRSQYPFTIVMVGYTMTSMWIIAQPYVIPPYV